MRREEGRDELGERETRGKMRVSLGWEREVRRGWWVRKGRTRSSLELRARSFARYRRRMS